MSTRGRRQPPAHPPGPPRGAHGLRGSRPAPALWRVGRDNWLPALISLLGGFEALMALRTAPTLTAAVGLVGGLVLVVAPWVPGGPRLRLLVVGVATVPFAALTWSSLATPVLAGLAIGIAVVARRPVPR